MWKVNNKMKNMKIENNKKNNNHIKAPVSLENTTEINIFSLFKWGKIGYYIEFNDKYITQKRYLGYNEAYNNFKVNLALFISLIFNCFKKEIFKICTFGNLVVVCCLRLFMVFFGNSYLINYIIHIRIFFCIILFILLIIICYIFCIGLIKREYMEYVTKRLVNNIGLWLTGLIVTYSLIGLCFVGVYLYNNFKELSSITLKYFLMVICYIWLFIYGIRHRGNIPFKWAVIPPIMLNPNIPPVVAPLIPPQGDIQCKFNRFYINSRFSPRHFNPEINQSRYERNILGILGLHWTKEKYFYNWANTNITIIDNNSIPQTLNGITLNLYNRLWTQYGISSPVVNRMMEMRFQMGYTDTIDSFVSNIIDNVSTSEILPIIMENEYYAFEEGGNPDYNQIKIKHFGDHPALKLANVSSVIICNELRTYRRFTNRSVNFKYIGKPNFSIYYNDIRAILNNEDKIFLYNTWVNNKSKFSLVVGSGRRANELPDNFTIVGPHNRYKNINAFLEFKFQ